VDACEDCLHESGSLLGSGHLAACRALLLDSAYRPIRVLNWQRAVRRPWCALATISV
jgi:hypothetical protein